MSMRMQMSIYRQKLSMYIGKRICCNLLVYCFLCFNVSAQPSRELLFHPDTVDLTCHVCNASHFCKYGHRYKCPEHSLAPDPSASTIEECVCVPGYLRVGDHCNLGTPPYYYQDGLQFSCGNNRVTVTAGASLKSQCVCPPGTEGEPGGDVACVGCAADFYNEQYNASCVQCAVHSSHSQTKSRNATDCLCDAGFTGPNSGPCAACAAGSFKAGAGSAACTLCEADEYSLSAAAACESCHANSSSEAGSDELADCECNAGFSGADGGPCVLCAVGKFKDSIANEACSDCLDNSFSEFEGATSCVSCLDSSAHSTGRDRCLCNAGYTQADTVDTRPDCTPCAVNTYQPGSGETSCFECDANAHGPEASATPITCLCNAGFFDGGVHLCESCAAGTFKEAASTPEEDEDVCSACPLYANSLPRSAASSDCLCNAGYTGTIGALVQTAVTWTEDDYYSLTELTITAGYDITITSPAAHPFIIMKVESHPSSPGVGSSEVFANPIVDHTTSTATTTVKIPTDYTEQLWWYCAYHSGMPHGELLWNVVNTCEACDPGHFKPANGSAACAECTLNFFSDTSASTACESCVEFLNSDGAKTDASASDSSDDCVCDLGLGYVEILDQDDARTCTGCQPGAFATNEGCANCTNGQFSDVVGLTACKDCPANSSSYDYPHVACQCHAGYFCASGNITCPTGDCVACSVNTFKDDTGGASQCEVCQINSHSALASVSQEDCNCDAGYYEEGSFSVLTDRDAEYFCSVEYSFDPSECVNGNFYSLFWSETVDFCQWSIIYSSYGHRGEIERDVPWTVCDDPNFCLYCPEACNNFRISCAGQYIDRMGNYVADDELIRSEEHVLECLDRCQVSDSLWTSSRNCLECDDGFVSFGLDLQTCVACPKHTYTQIDKSGLQACIFCGYCGSLQYDAARGGLGCGAGSPSDCQECPLNSRLVRETESCSEEDCTWEMIHSEACNDRTADGGYLALTILSEDIATTCGYHNIGIQSCMCVANYYGANGTCTACPANSEREFTESNSLIADCLCSAGFEPDAAAHECRACPVNTYKTGPGDYSCTACPDTLVTEFEGNTNIDACVCPPGYFYADPVCQVCEADTFKPGYNRDILCTACRDHSISEAGSVISTDCKCILGFEVYLDAAIVDANRLLRVGSNNYNNEADPQPWGAPNPLASCPFVQTFYLSETGQSKLCDQIPSPYVISHPGAQSMWAYQQFKFQLPVGTSNWLTPSLTQITLTGWFGGKNKELLGAAAGEYIYNQYLISHPDLQCASCVPGKFKNLILNEFCTDCAINTFTSEYEQHSCASCVVGKSTVGLLGQSYCECDYGTERESSNVLSGCQHCAEGKFKTDASYDEPDCQNCSHCGADQQVDTVCNRFQDITCKACQDHSWSYAGRTELGPCFCDAGYELVGSECVACPIGKARTTNVNNSIACETCQDGKFADTAAATECEFCAAHCNATISVGSNLTYKMYVTEECEATSDTVCAACTPCPPGQYAIQSCGIPFNNDRNDTKCALCPAGFYCPGGVEGAGVDVQPIVCPNNALSVPGSDDIADCSCNPGYYRVADECVLCEYDFYCPGSGVTVACPAHSITQHRGSSQRLDCHCLGGYYRSPADEAHFNCKLCTPNDYCFNNSLYNCSDARMLAEPGSSSPEDCVCMDGFYNTGAVCTECAVNHFCVGGVQTVCVANEWTNGQTGQAECLCRPGLARGAGGRQYAIAVPNARCHYTQELSQTTLEECKEVCTNRLCAGFYYYSEFLNLGFGPMLTSLCGMCAFPQHFVNGTVNATGQHDIYAPLPTTTCGTCTENFFCDGSDDAEHACPADSVSAAGSSSLSDCLCVAGFEHVHPVNQSEPHTCRSCVAGATFKTSIGNHACGQCTVCSASIDFVFQGVACAPIHDATCIPCTVCSQTGDRYETSPCQDFVDTQCAACQQCNFTTHFISQECFELSNRECTAIAYDLQCADGQYAGGHTTHTQTRCLPCRYNDTLYVGAHLHVGGSPGRVYNDPYSCKSACLPFSRLRNTEAHYLGCETCETGNVLFKVFSQDPSHVECRFTCLPGFEKSRNNSDCTLGALSASDQNFAHHFVNVSRIDRPAMLGDDASGFTLTVVHTKHSRFVVVVGAGEPTCTGRESRVVTDDCCYGSLWRVSQTTQMGLPANASEQCSKAPRLPTARLDDTTLSFALPDRRLQEVGSCVEDNGRLDCTLTVSIVDLILFNTYSVPVHVSRVGSTTLAAVGQSHRYVPLSKLRVDVYVAFVTDAGVVLLVTTDLQASEHALTVSLHGTGLMVTNAQENAELRACARHSIGAADEETSERVLQAGETAAFSTFLLSPSGLPESCTLKYTLDLGADSVMQVAVWRNLTLQSVLCVETQEMSVNAGLVQISHGLGASVIHRRVVLPKPEATVYGRLGMLSTLVATATLSHITQVQLGAVLAAHALPSAQHLLLNATVLHEGVLDFRPAFRSACRATTACEYKYLQYDPLHRGMFLFTDCSSSTQTLARAWIQQVLGVPHDDGHVAAICADVSNGRPFLVALVNTHAYLHALHAHWNFFQDWTASTSQTALFALFKFK